MKKNITVTTDGERTRFGGSGAMLLVAAVVCCIGLSACGDDASRDGEYDGSTDTTPGAMGQPAPASGLDTTSSPGAGSTTVVPPPTADEIRRQLAEKFGLMGGMSRVNIETDSSGVVTLSGTVKSPDRKQTAEDAAAMVPGVIKVENGIRVEE